MTCLPRGSPLSLDYRALHVTNAVESEASPDSVSADDVSRQKGRSTFSLPVDVYGFIVLRLVELAAGDSIQNRAPHLHLFVATILYLLYLVLVFGVTIFLMVLVDNQAVQWEDESFMARHSMSLTDASHLLLDLTDPMVTVNASYHPGIPDALFETCQDLNNVPQRYIYYLMVFYWVMKMWTEFKSARDWCMNMWLVDTHSRPDQRIMSEDGTKILAIPQYQKVIVFIFVALVKFVIFLMVLHIGCVFLLMQKNGFALVIKVMAMSVVLGIDEQVVDSLALREASKKLRETQLVLRTERNFLHRIYWYDGVGGLVFLLIAMLVVLLYMKVLFVDLMDLRWSCNEYLRDGWMPFDLRHAEVYLEN